MKIRKEKIKDGITLTLLILIVGGLIYLITVIKNATEEFYEIGELSDFVGLKDMLIIPGNILGDVSGKAGADISMNFKGHFESDEYRTLEKKNLTCIDAFSYGSYTKKDPIFEERLSDNGCVVFTIVNKTNYYKCPLRNCKLIEKKHNRSDGFIPEELNIERVSVNGEGQITGSAEVY